MSPTTRPSTPAPARPVPRPLRVALTSLCLLVVLVLGAACEPTSSSGGPIGTKPAVPASGTYLGLWVRSEAPSAAGRRADFEKVESMMGRSAAIGHTYRTFADPFPAADEQWHLDRGRTPLISWNGARSSEILDGRHDDLIRARARAVRALDQPIFLRYFWEPDSAAKSALAGSPAAYVAAWRHVHRIFTEERVGNAAWVWCPTAWGFRNGAAAPTYPGDAYVDWICADGYNWGSVQGGDRWADVATIFGAFHAFGKAHAKPMMVGEWGSVEGAPGAKAAWLDQARNQFRSLPGIRAVVYFHSRREEQGAWCDWRVDSSETSAEAFARLAGDSYFSR